MGLDILGKFKVKRMYEHLSNRGQTGLFIIWKGCRSQWTKTYFRKLMDEDMVLEETKILQAAMLGAHEALRASAGVDGVL